MINNAIIKVIKQRRSIRSFKDEQIKENELQAVLEAGLYAPFAWENGRHFTVVQNQELLKRLNIEAKEAAKQMDFEHLRELGSNENFNCLYNAPTLIIVSGDEQVPIPLDADCASAVQNMLIAAESVGLGTCWIFFVLMAFNSQNGPELREILKIPEGYKPFYAVLFGYKKNEVVEVPERKPDSISYIR